jgi:hypothetical protein
MFTRTPEQIALSETSRVCRQIMHLCADAAEQASDSGVRLLMSSLAETHERLLSSIDARIRATGDLPRSPDPDFEAVKELATRTKKVFASDPDTVLIDERIADEQELLAEIAKALALELSAESQACFQAAQRTARDALQTLHAERELRNPV